MTKSAYIKTEVHGRRQKVQTDVSPDHNNPWASSHCGQWGSATIIIIIIIVIIIIIRATVQAVIIV